MDGLRTKYEGLIRSRNTHELSQLRDEIDMALIRIQRDNDQSSLKLRGEGKRH